MKKEVELIIIGAGIAGVNAAIYAKRSGLDFLIFESTAVGGQLLLMEGIDNYVGLPLGTKGRDLVKELENTLAELEISLINQRIEKIKIENNKVWLSTSTDEYCAKTLIIATGAAFKRLGVAGETEFLGKGVSYCAVCDGFFFRGKDVAVIGGGNTAAEEALYLSEIVSKVILIHRRDQLRAIDFLQKEILAKKNIEILYDSIVKEVKGTELMEKIVIENTKTKQEKILPLQGIFIAIGIKPNTDIFTEFLEVDKEGYIITDETMQTSSKLVWVAGDCRKRQLKQLITAAAEGALATMSIYKSLRGHYISA